MPGFDIADCINESCPWSGEPIRSLTRCSSQVVGFCNTGCHDKFKGAIHNLRSGIELLARQRA